MDYTKLPLWALVAAGAFFVAREAYKAILKRVLAQAAEASRLALTERKAELDRHAEYLRHGMARDLMQADLRARSLHRVYPIVSKRLHEAFGLTAAAWSPASYERDYSRLSTGELMNLVGQYVLDERERNELIDEIQNRPREAADHFYKLGRRKKFADAEVARSHAHNYILFKRLYMSDEAFGLAMRIDQLLVSIWVDARMFHLENAMEREGQFSYKAIQAQVEEAGTLLEKLDKQMRTELSPTEGTLTS